MMKFIYFLSFLIIANSFAVETKSPDLLEVNKTVAAIMGMMHLPGMGVSTLASKGDFTSKHFKQASSDFVQQTRKMAAIKHPDKAFRVFNEDMLEKLKAFEKSITLEDPESIKKSWKVVMGTCQSCHSVYHAKQK